jgi:Domain of unknown function (DUF4279)
MTTNGDKSPIDISTVDRGLPYYAYSATLRISGTIDDLDGLSTALGLAPSHTHRRGERAGHPSQGYKDDAWHYTVPIQEERPLDEHIQALWGVLKPHRDYLLELSRTLDIDVFCAYRTNHWGAGIHVLPESLEMFTALAIPFGISIIVV